VPDAKLLAELEESAKNISDETKFMEEAKKRVDGYKRQDDEKNRVMGPDDIYVTPEFLYRKWVACDGKCNLCTEEMLLSNTNKWRKSRLWTWDRDDNSRPHVQNNGRMNCHRCNSADLET